MHIIVAILGFLLLTKAAADAFQTVVVARHAQELPPVKRWFYQLTWGPFRDGRWTNLDGSVPG